MPRVGDDDCIVGGWYRGPEAGWADPVKVEFAVGAHFGVVFGNVTNITLW